MHLLMITGLHIEPLNAFAASLRAELGDSYQIPGFDPQDGGVDARALFLLEAPGPKAVVSGRVSQDNPDPSARKQFAPISGE